MCAGEELLREISMISLLARARVHIRLGLVSLGFALGRVSLGLRWRRARVHIRLGRVSLGFALGRVSLSLRWRRARAHSTRSC